MHQLHGSHLLCAAGGALLRAAAKAWRTAQTRMITRTPPHRSKRQGRDAAVWRSACGACEAGPGFERIARVLRNSALRHQGEGDIASNAPTAWFSPPPAPWTRVVTCIMMQHDGGAQYTSGPANTHAQSSLRGRSTPLVGRKTSASIR